MRFTLSSGVFAFSTKFSLSSGYLVRASKRYSRSQVAVAAEIERLCERPVLARERELLFCDSSVLVFKASPLFHDHREARLGMLCLPIFTHHLYFAPTA